MILVDTSVWVDHIRAPSESLISLLREGRCAMHPFVLGEIALGNLPDWSRSVARLQALPTVKPVNDATLMTFVAEARLAGSGLGFVDVHLLAACLRRREFNLWTRDKRLAAMADTLQVGWEQAL